MRRKGAMHRGAKVKSRTRRRLAVGGRNAKKEQKIAEKSE